MSGGTHWSPLMMEHRIDNPCWMRLRSHKPGPSQWVGWTLFAVCERCGRRYRWRTTAPGPLA